MRLHDAQSLHIDLLLLIPSIIFCSQISHSATIKQENIKNITIEEIINNIPPDLLLDYADRYIGKELGQFESITAQIRKELKDNQLISAHPWKSIVYSISLRVLDPIGLLICFVVFVLIENKIEAIFLSAIMSALIIETILTNTQLTRSWGEGIVIGLFGGLAQSLAAYGFTKFKKYMQISHIGTTS